MLRSRDDGGSRGCRPLLQHRSTALLRCDVQSDALGMGTSFTVVVPQGTGSDVGVAGRARERGHPVLYLLHGLSDDGTAWSRHTAVERYASARGLAVVMPGVGRSWYADEVAGQRYWTYLTEELPTLVQSSFAFSAEREDVFVAGLSMGGYGALKWALREPGRFAAAASLSGALDVAALRRRSREQDDDLRPDLDRAFGDREVAGTDDDLLALLERVDPAVLPALHVACGTEDELVGDNRRFVEAARGRGVDVTTDLGPGGHEWGYWDAGVRDVVARLPLTG